MPCGSSASISDEKRIRICCAQTVPGGNKEQLIHTGGLTVATVESTHTVDEHTAHGGQMGGNWSSHQKSKFCTFLQVMPDVSHVAG